MPGEITREKPGMLRQGRRDQSRGDRQGPGLYDQIWQAFAVLPPVKTVGVVGDGRTCDPRLRPARRHLHRRRDGEFLPLPARPAWPHHHPHHHDVRGINRMVYDYTSKPSGTIEWE